MRGGSSTTPERGAPTLEAQHRCARAFHRRVAGTHTRLATTTAATPAIMLDRTTPSSGLGQLGVGGLLYDALTGRVGGVDQVVPVGHHVVILNRMPITSRGRLIGSVTTLRDRTELVSLQRELDVTRHTTESGTSSTTPSTRCGTQHSWVEVTVNQTPDDVTVVVRDSGPGVPADLEGRICFSTKSSTVGGRGSGLALIQHICGRRNGEARVCNDPGAVFTVRLPIGGTVSV